MGIFSLEVDINREECDALEHLTPEELDACKAELIEVVTHYSIEMNAVVDKYAAIVKERLGGNVLPFPVGPR